MTTPSRLVRVVVPLANDAIDDADGRYHTVGPNFEVRFDAALQEAKRCQQSSSADVYLAFGAGTDRAHAHGPTLAACCAAHATNLGVELPLLVNTRARTCFGTLPEIQWVVAAAHVRFPDRPVEFVFVSQPRHLWRVRVAVWLFMPRLRVRYVPSGYTKQVPLLREALGYLRLILTRFGLGWIPNLLRRRWTLPFDRG